MFSKQPTRDVFVIKNNLEKQEIVKQYLAFESLPYSEKQRLWGEWNKYYIDVRSTTAYAMYREIQKEFKNKNMVKFRSILSEMKDMKENGVIPKLMKPEGVDPMTFYHDQTVLSYKSILSEITQKKEANLEF